MNPKLADILRCPAPDCCGDELKLQIHHIEIIPYRACYIEEVREGTLHCPKCARSYPIEEYVPSFEGLFPEDLREEADYWSRWYGFWWERSQLGFFDLNAPRAPLITHGIEVLDPSSVPGGTTTTAKARHHLLTEEALIREAKLVLDIGCGTGWSSLEMARNGHDVVALDPSGMNMRLAKRYAIEQGEYIEYLAAALGYVSFKRGSFDAAVALHSIHHVPELGAEVIKLRDWLREDGVIAVDEHVGTNPTLLALERAMFAWAEADIYPGVCTLDKGELRGLPQARHSSLEGAGSEDLIKALITNFELERFHSRYVSLDFFSFLYYLSREMDPSAYHYAADVLNRAYTLLMEAYPEGAEYVTLVGRKVSGAGEGVSVSPMPPVSPIPPVSSRAPSHPPRADRLDAEAREHGDGSMEARLERSERRLVVLKAERVMLRRHTSVIERELRTLQQEIGVKNRRLQELQEWAIGMERAIAIKNRELKRQGYLLRMLPLPLRWALDRLALRGRKGKRT